MPGQISSFSFKEVVVMIDQNLVEGYFEGDDVVMVDRNSDTANAMIGADGNSIVSVSADDTALVTLKLQPGSAANQYLENKHKRQRSGSIRPFSVSVLDTTNGEGGSGPEAVITKRPQRSFGTNATVREWVLFVGCWTDNDITYTI